MTDIASPSAPLARRRFLVGAASVLALAAAGCTTSRPTAPVVPPAPPIPEWALLMYGPKFDEQFPLPAVDLRQIEPQFWRQRVDYPTNETPGTVIVDTGARFLYHVEEGGTAMRYGVGIGRAGFTWSGRAHIAYKREWPVWTPPSAMIERQPELEQWRHGQPPGLTNPLGARALYIHQGGQDTLYRLRGTSEDWSIGRAVSSGCVRLLNHDIIDLYDRVRSGSALVVLPSTEPMPFTGVTQGNTAEPFAL